MPGRAGRPATTGPPTVFEALASPEAFTSLVTGLRSALASGLGWVFMVGAVLSLLAFVVSTVADTADTLRLQPEHHAIIRAAWEPVSVAELASHLTVGLGDDPASTRRSTERALTF